MRSLPFRSTSLFVPFASSTRPSLVLHTDLAAFSPRCHRQATPTWYGSRKKRKRKKIKKPRSITPFRLPALKLGLDPFYSRYRRRFRAYQREYQQSSGKHFVYSVPNCRTYCGTTSIIASNVSWFDVCFFGLLLTTGNIRMFFPCVSLNHVGPVRFVSVSYLHGAPMVFNTGNLNGQSSLDRSLTIYGC